MLSDGNFYRVGGHQPLHADVRIIAATNQNLERRVAEGKFREDLFHRLNVIRIRLPSLKERSEDIPLLAHHFLIRTAKELGVEVKRLEPDAMEALTRYPFPGNVRQLENVCRWITVMAPSQNVRAEDLPEEVRNWEAGKDAALPEGHMGALSDWKDALSQTVSDMLDRGAPDIMESLRNQFERTVIEAALEKSIRPQNRRGGPAWHGSEHHHAEDQRTADGRVKILQSLRDFLRLIFYPPRCAEARAASGISSSCRKS